MAHEHAGVRSVCFFASALNDFYSTPRMTPPKFTEFPLLYTKTLLTLPFDKGAHRDSAKTTKFMVTGRGYSTQQSTRPQTLGYGLSDSPVGLLAWIYEKLVGWTDKYPWTDDEGVASYHPYPKTESTILICFHPQCSNGSPYIGFRAPGRQPRRGFTMRRPTEATTGLPSAWAGRLSRSACRTSLANSWPFRNCMCLLLYSPFSALLGFESVTHSNSHVRPSIYRWSHSLGKVVFESEHDAGGHFAAFEVPEKLAGDLRKMYGKGGSAYGVVAGKSGYDGVQEAHEGQSKCIVQ